MALTAPYSSAGTHARLLVGGNRLLMPQAQLQVVRRSFVVPGSGGAEQCSLLCPEASYLRSQCPNLLLERAAVGAGPYRAGHARITGTGCIVPTGRTGCIVPTVARFIHRGTGLMSLRPADGRQVRPVATTGAYKPASTPSSPTAEIPPEPCLTMVDAASASRTVSAAIAPRNATTAPAKNAS